MESKKNAKNVNKKSFLRNENIKNLAKILVYCKLKLIISNPLQRFIIPQQMGLLSFHPSPLNTMSSYWSTVLWGQFRPDFCSCWAIGGYK